MSIRNAMLTLFSAAIVVGLGFSARTTVAVPAPPTGCWVSDHIDEATQTIGSPASAIVDLRTVTTNYQRTAQMDVRTAALVKGKIEAASAAVEAARSDQSARYEAHDSNGNLIGTFVCHSIEVRLAAGQLSGPCGAGGLPVETCAFQGRLIPDVPGSQLGRCQ